MSVPNYFVLLFYKVNKYMKKTLLKSVCVVISKRKPLMPANKVVVK